MSAPWKTRQTTMEKVEERVSDWLDQLNIDERVEDFKDQIASSEHAELLREKIPGVTPAKQSHKRRNVALLALVGVGAVAFVHLRKKAAEPAANAPTFPAPQSSPTQAS